MRKLWRLGFQASLAEIVTAGAALQFSLAGRQQDGGAAFVIGSRALIDHVAQAGLRVVNNTEFATRADIVVVADHQGFNYVELRVATQAVLRGAELIGLTRDRTFPMPDGPWPGGGAVLAAIEAACARTADEVVGKPEPGMYDTARDRLGEGRVLAIGDRLDADVAGARAGGARLGARADRRHGGRGGHRGGEGGGRPHVRRRLACRFSADPVRRRRHQTHHNHSSKKGYRRLLDKLAAHEDVHRVATGRVKPRMGTGRPVATISKIREIESGLSITINTEGAVIDAYVVTSDPAGVAAWLRDEGLAL